MNLAILLVAFVVSEVTVTVRDESTKDPLPGANVLIRDGQATLFTDETGPDGTVKVNRQRDGADVYITATPYEDYYNKWPLDNNEALLYKPVTRVYRFSGSCYQSIQVVTMKAVDEHRVARQLSYKTARIPCGMPNPIDIGPPITPPPSGYAYELSYVTTWRDAPNRRIVHRPYFRLVPLAQSPKIQSPPCGCQQAQPLGW